MDSQRKFKDGWMNVFCKLYISMILKVDFGASVCENEKKRSMFVLFLAHQRDLSKLTHNLRKSFSISPMTDDPFINQI